MKNLNKWVITLTAVCIIVLILSTSVSINREKQLVEYGTKIVKLVYNYHDMATVENHMATLHDLVTPEVFALLDNTDERIFTRRFIHYTTTISEVKEVMVNAGKETTMMIIIGFNPASELKERVITLKLNSKNIVTSFEERIFEDPFDQPSDMLRGPTVHIKDVDEN